MSSRFPLRPISSITAFEATGSKNKPRIFLAYYDRAARPGNEPYHVAILVRSHPLEDKPDSAMRFHAVNKIQPPSNGCPEAREVWMFESKASWFVTPQLAGLMYLGKLPEGKSTDDVAKICASVPVDSTGEGGRRCSHWVWDTLQVRVIYLSALVFQLLTIDLAARRNGYHPTSTLHQPRPVR